MQVLFKRLLIFFIGIFIINNQGFAQTFLEWSKNYGGSNSDVAIDIEKIATGGYIVAGWSSSANGDVGGNNGGQDVWVVKLDIDGNLVWEKNYGGSDDDIATSIKQTNDSGFIVAGYSRSNDGDVGGNNGEQDCWIIKLDSEGNLEWAENFGGTDKDLAVDIVQAPDNGYAFLSHSESSNGDVGGNNGGRDYWIVKLDSEGNLEWEKNYGGTVWDTPSAIKVVASGGYIVSGWAGSIDGDVIANYGSNDSWLLKLDNEGNLEWQKNYGGSDNDVTYDMDQTMDGGYVLVGRTKSNDFDVEGNNGEHDSWIIKLDSEGNLEWGKEYGGSENDAALSVKQTSDGKYIIAGDSDSNDADVAGNNGDQDSWIIMLDNEGNLEWQNNYGGSNTDRARDVIQVADNEFIVANWSESIDGDIAENNGGSDFWLIKLSDQDPNSIHTTNFNTQVTISPNPSNGQCTINTNDLNSLVNVTIYSVMGQSIYRKDEVQGPLNIDNLPKGNYYVQIVNDDYSIIKKLIVH